MYMYVAMLCRMLCSCLAARATLGHLRDFVVATFPPTLLVLTYMAGVAPIMPAAFGGKLSL